ncbi:fibrobacter succinogenes major paralogous domain-containing protein [Fibrobacter sp. UBA3629]|uniref:fibrobacter succinogenes major paralogous domain-containing protein n=1 Tax=Fibrobacter sp. UBA3629 TaxID=1946530 RepID=UPI0025C61871|nr:fibrobacter succinogenes major paralogous domain-containing protein [Fibrobacter sp. UBA3629]
MKAYKRTPKSVIATLKSFQGLVTLFAILLAACGGDSGSGAKAPEPAEGANDGREVATLVDMGRCTSEREGDTVYVAEKLTDYLCQNKTWVDLSEVSSDMSSGNTDSDTKSSSSKGTGSSDETDPSSSDSDTDTPEGFVRENISVTGVAQKGPFKFGSPLNLYELKKNLTPSGTVYKDEISSNKGDFVIPKVSLAYPYAKLEVRGLYRNEVTGEWSTDSMTLRALTDFSEERTDVNINLLTHLEYDRALYLVQEKGYSVYAAKKQAAQEIMTAFEFATAVTYSEDFAIFQNEGVSATTSAGNATLLAISALVMGNRSDVEIQNTIDKFIADIKTDGEWNDLQTKASMADWAYDFNYSTIKASVKSWNILDIPAYETYLDIYWNNIYGLGGCSVNRKDVVAPNSNKLSKNYNKYFICNGSQWVAATTYQKDTYEWATGKTGEYKKGNVTDSIYVYNDTKWEVSERETTIGLCQNSNAGVVSKFNGTYYICKNNAWGTATVLEYDTYGLTGVEGDVKAGVVNKDKYYVYENGAWRAAANDQEIALGVCTTAREGVVAKDGDTYYICKSKTWATATTLEYDTYGWNAGTEGEVKAGSVNTDNYYVYENGMWRASANAIENNLGACVTSREGEKQILNSKYYICENKNWKQISAEEYGLGYCSTANEGVVDKMNGVYYICKSKNWTKATVLEYDTYGKTCLMDGSIIDGEVVASNKYVCDASAFRIANRLEKNLDKGCVSYTEGDEIRKTLSATHDSVYHCKNLEWKGTIEFKEYGFMVDSRDNRTYKTVIIGNQTWMAENLNYYYKYASYCYDNDANNCSIYGRLYSAHISNFDSICPNGWHIPDTTEWRVLFDAVGGQSIAAKVLKSLNWNSGNGTDIYGFAALPAGYTSNYGYDIYEGEAAFFWSAPGNTSYRRGVNMYNNRDDAVSASGSAIEHRSVRCIKN